MDIPQFIKDRDEAIVSMDKTKIEAYCRKYGVTMPDDEQTFWAGIHKSITALTTIDREKRLQSVKWLTEHGYDHFMSDITPEELEKVG